LSEQTTVRFGRLTIRRLMIAIGAVALGAAAALNILDAYPTLMWRITSSRPLMTALALGTLLSGLSAITFGIARLLSRQRPL
jgi:hypothetical protein